MFLLLNLSERDLINLSLFDEKTIYNTNFTGRNKDLLICIDKFLSKQSLKKENLRGIMVVVGSGGFTSTRISVVIANTFAYVLNIPVLAIDVKQSSRPQKLIPKLLKQPILQYITASYSAEPNITKSRSNKSISTTIT